MASVHAFGIDPSQLTSQALEAIVESGLAATQDETKQAGLRAAWVACGDQIERRVEFLRGPGRDLYSEYWRLRFIEQATTLAAAVGEPLRVASKPSPRVMKSRFGRFLAGAGLLGVNENEIPRAARLRFSLALIVLGFSLVIVNYFLIPTLAGGLLDVATTGLDRTVKDLQAKIDASYSRQLEQGTQEKISEASLTVSGLNQSVSALMNKIQALEAPAGRVVAAFDGLKAAKSNETLQQAAVVFAPYKRDGQEQESPSEAYNYLKAIADHLAANPEAASQRALAISLVLQKVERNSALSASEKAIVTALRVEYDSARTKPRVFFVGPEGLKSVPDVTAVANSLAVEARELRESESKLQEALKNADADLKKTFETVAPNTDPTTTVNLIRSQLDTTKSNLQSLNQELVKRTDLITQREDLTNSMLKAFDDIRATASNNANLSSFTAGPAVFVVLGIAAMFVTVGLQSLLRWAKSGDDEVAEAQARDRMRALTETYARLHLLGIPARAHLDNMQELFPAYDRRAGSVSLPAIRTIEELVKTVKNS